MENEFENEESGITVGYIFRTIFSQKWLALIIAVVITVIGTVGIYFYGRLTMEYSVSFVLQLPNTGDATTTMYTYPDGESFYYTDLISSERLREVAGRDGFDKIDVDKIVKNNAISITRTVDKIVNSTEGVYDLNYTVTVKARYFPDEDCAREFIEALTAFPRDYIREMDINYDQSLTSSQSAVTYDQQITILKSQAVYIQSKYAELINAYGKEFLLEDGRTLAQCKDEIDTYITGTDDIEDIFTSLTEIAKKNGYIKGGTEEKLRYESQLYSKNRELDKVIRQIEYLSEFANGTGAIIYDDITKLTGQRTDYEDEIEILERYLASYSDESKIAPADFEAEIKNVETAVAKFTDDIKPVASEVYGRVTKINFLSSRVVEEEGGTGLLMSAVISLVAGIVIAAIVAYIVGWNKERKGRIIKAVPVYGEAQLQIAITEDEDKKDTK